ncbi:MAG: PEP-CTERM sorting domain-containing protein [Thermoguttaceae bacterium]
MFRRCVMALGVVSLLVLVTAGQANAAVVVTFYNDQASFMAAISPQAALNFEGITTDTGNYDFGTSYHTGSVTFTAGKYNHMLVVGKNSQTLGKPFDSALLTPWSEPSSILATFDASSNVTAVGGYFESLIASSLGTFSLTGATGLLDQRGATLGWARQGQPKKFYGYTVAGDTILSLSVGTGVDAPAFDNFTYGYSVPEPSSLILLGIAAASLSAYAWRRRRQAA